MNSSVGLIGIGLLGSAIADRLIDCGHHVFGYDPNADLKSFESRGGKTFDSSAAVARSSSALILCLPDSNVATEVVSEIQSEVVRDGSNTIVIDTTTGSPDSAAIHGERLGRLGVSYLDATVAGSSQMMRDHEATLLVGGDENAFAAAKSIFDCIGRRTYFLGQNGTGAKMKLVVNLAIGLNRAVLAEAMAFGESFGFDSQLVLDVLMDTPAHSDAMDTKGPKMASCQFQPQARLRQHLKDVGLIVRSAQQNGATVPFSELHQDILNQLVARGFGEEDNSAVIRAFRPDEC